MLDNPKLCSLKYSQPITQEELDAYYDFRWHLLRQPWGKEKGSEKDELEHQSYHRMLVDDKGSIYAIIRLHIVEQSKGIIRYMAVAEHAQGMGVGKHILSLLENEIAQFGVTQIELNARENAIPFYQAANYQLGEFSHLLFEEIPHYKMTKALNQTLSAKGKSLTNVWHETIPVSAIMGIEVSFYDEQCLIVSANVEVNKNLHNTMFAGSIYTLATLTGWGWVYLKLQDEGLCGDIVLAQGNIRYLAPINHRAIACLTENKASGKLALLKKGRKARVKVEVEVKEGDNITAVFEGSYVVIPETKRQN